MAALCTDWQAAASRLHHGTSTLLSSDGAQCRSSRVHCIGLLLGIDCWNHSVYAQCLQHNNCTAVHSGRYWHTGSVAAADPAAAERTAEWCDGASVGIDASVARYRWLRLRQSTSASVHISCCSHAALLDELRVLWVVDFDADDLAVSNIRAAN